MIMELSKKFIKFCVISIAFTQILIFLHIFADDFLQTLLIETIYDIIYFGLSFLAVLLTLYTFSIEIYKDIEKEIISNQFFQVEFLALFLFGILVLVTIFIQSIKNYVVYLFLTMFFLISFKILFYSILKEKMENSKKISND